MKKKNAFTLIELLAVIVILAIIALIATPIILGIVEDARKDSFMRSVELVVGTTDIDIFSKDFSSTYTYTITDGVIPNLEVGVKNTAGMNGKIKYDSKGNDTYAIHNGKYCVIKTSGMKKAEIKDYVEGECELSNATDASYFTYKYLEIEDVEIVNVDACMEFLKEGTGATDDIATTLCNNGAYDWNNGRWDAGILTLPEFLEAGYRVEWALELRKAGAIEFTAKGIEITEYSEEGPKDIIIPDEIDGYKVVSIGNFAFSNMSLTSVELPDTIINIGHSAFSTNLLTEITLPSSLEEIDDYAFCYNNLNQTSVDNIEDINEYAYCTVTDGNCFTYEDKELKVYEYEIIDKDACVEFMTSEWDYDEEEATIICNNEPYDGMILTEYLATRSEDALENIADLKEAGVIEEHEIPLEGIEITGYNCSKNDIVIPNKIGNKEVVSIGGNVFQDSELTSVALPDTIIDIDDYAFASNEISKLKLSFNLSHIDYYAFYNNNLQKVIIPKNVGEIGQCAFSTNSIQEIVLGSSSITWGFSVFCNNPIKSHPQIFSNVFGCPAT